MLLNTIMKYLNTILTPEEIIEKDDYYILPTICHNLEHQGAQHKLYLYKNTETGYPLFHCYTECSETFSIYELVKKRAKLQDITLSFQEILEILQLKRNSSPTPRDEKVKLRTVSVNPLSRQLPVLDETILYSFQTGEGHPWTLEGITSEVLKEFEVSYCPLNNQVILPQRDLEGNLIGIRVRNYNAAVEQYAKYCPLKIGNTYYSHPLSQSFFGLYQNMEEIIETKTAVLYEGEKSVLLHKELLGRNDALAVCGKSISNWHMELLLSFKIQRLYIAFDKEYQTYPEVYNYIQKISQRINRLENVMDVIYIVDMNNILPPKASPIDFTIQHWKNLRHIRSSELLIPNGFNINHKK